jgi:ABC-type multidrug transport system fused ATPase/permease subunit
LSCGFFRKATGLFTVGWVTSDGKMTDIPSKASVGFERIREVLGTESQIRDSPGARRAPKFKGEVEFENVDFGYCDSQPGLVLTAL